MSQLYPLKFRPVFIEKVWGGRKMESFTGCKLPPGKNIGEAWLLSGVENNESLVEKGFLKDNTINELVEVYMGDLVGDSVFEKYGREFPVLIKILDANDWLSVQVHPDDDLALKRHGTFGKSEMWYILEAGKDALLVDGLRDIRNRNELKKHVAGNTVKDILKFQPVKKNEAYYLQSGRVHALGPGILLAEIQQTSDITYRIFDWDRIDAAGFKRELHVEQALDAIDYKQVSGSKVEFNEVENETSEIISCNHFTTNILNLSHPLRKDFTELDSFVIYLCLEGNTVLRTIGGEAGLNRGEVVLIPASLDTVDILPGKVSKLLEVYIR